MNSTTDVEVICVLGPIQPTQATREKLMFSTETPKPQDLETNNLLGKVSGQPGRSEVDADQVHGRRRRRRLAICQEAFRADEMCSRIQKHTTSYVSPFELQHAAVRNAVLPLWAPIQLPVSRALTP